MNSNKLIVHFLQLIALLPTLAVGQEAAAAPSLRRPPMAVNAVTDDDDDDDDDDNHHHHHRELIIGGTSLSGTDRYPYFALMSGSGRCGAVLISKRFVLTAAHCVGADDDFQIGITDLSETHEEYTFSHGEIHPEYNDDTNENDIAIFELSRDVPSKMTPITWKTSRVPEGTPVTVIGFGDTDPDRDGQLSSTLRKANVETVQDSTCELMLCAHFVAHNPDTTFAECLDRRYIREGMVCGFDFDNGTGSCGGDSGGPIILEDESGDPSGDRLIGLVSWGSRYKCGQQNPSVYIDIPYFSQWIVKSMCHINPNRIPDNVLCTMDRIDFPQGWTDSDNDGCDFYAGDSRYCEEYGHSYESDGWVANQVCVVCGGGRTVSDSNIVDGTTMTPSWKVDHPQGWTDSDKRGCTWYAEDPQNCEEYGHLHSRWGRVANDVCAVCGGGKYVY